MKPFKIIAIAFVASVAYAICYHGDRSAFWVFFATFFAVAYVAPPRQMFSPLAALYGYFGVFYILPMAVAPMYADYDFADPPAAKALWMLSATLVIGALVLYTIGGGGSKTPVVRVRSDEIPRRRLLLAAVVVLWAFTFLCAVGVVQGSSGLAAWIENPGRAFLTREGTGLYTIGAKYGSMLTALLVGYYRYIFKRNIAFGMTLLMILAITPVLGGKSQVFISVAFLFAARLFDLPISLRSAIVGFAGLTTAFLFVTYLRNSTWITTDDLLEYSLNYFTTYDLLVMSVREFPAGSFIGTLLPFNKFLSPFGIQQGQFYDLSSFLTSIYFPTDWEIRATRQWPIETELYAGYYYIFGTPLLAMMFAVFGYAYRQALHTRSLGWIYAGIYLSFYMVSHLRGGLILWTDFYIFPILAAVLYFEKYAKMPMARLRPLQAPKPEVALA